MAHFAKITSQGLLNITWLVILLLAYRKNGVIETFQSDVAKRWLQPSAKRSVNKALLMEHLYLGYGNPPSFVIEFATVVGRVS
jgi:protoheme ferro-lyase